MSATSGIPTGLLARPKPVMKVVRRNLHARRRAYVTAIPTGFEPLPWPCRAWAIATATTTYVQVCRRWPWPVRSHALGGMPGHDHCPREARGTPTLESNVAQNLLTLYSHAWLHALAALSL
jgi:hypothetical protein